MIEKTLTYYTTRLDEYIRRNTSQQENAAIVGPICYPQGEKPCKLIVSLLSIERETSGGINMSARKHSAGYFRSNPPLLLNLNLIMAAVYTESKYKESLSALSKALKFIQSMPVFEMNGNTYTVEVVTLSIQEINNVWSTLGGQYYPSVVCKLRQIAIESGDITESGTIVEQTDIQIKS